MRAMIGIAGAVLLAGCGGGDAPAKKEVAAKLGAGLYEVKAEVTSLSPTDKVPAATSLKLAETVAARACVAADGAPDPALLAEAGDECTPQSNYIRNGRMSLQLVCKRAKGNLFVTIDGKFAADGFDGNADTVTQFTTPGNYKMTRKLTATRVGDCPADAPVKTASK